MVALLSKFTFAESEKGDLSMKKEDSQLDNDSQQHAFIQLEVHPEDNPVRVEMSKVKYMVKSPLL